jgi:hypothetical protein
MNGWGMVVPRSLVSEGEARSLVCNQVPLLAPRGKRYWTNHNPRDSQTLSLESPFGKQGKFQPFLESVRQILGITEQSRQGRVVAPTVPWNCDDRGSFRHGSSQNDKLPPWFLLE